MAKGYHVGDKTMSYDKTLQIESNTQKQNNEHSGNLDWGNDENICIVGFSSALSLYSWRMCRYRSDDYGKKTSGGIASGQL